MSETTAILVTLRRICEELEIISSSLRSLLDLMQAHKTVSDSEDFSSHNNDDRKTPDNIEKSE